MQLGTHPHLLKVRKALQAPVGLFPLTVDSKWAGPHAKTPLMNTTNCNAQIMQTLRRENLEVEEEKSMRRKERGN